MKKDAKEEVYTSKIHALVLEIIKDNRTIAARTSKLVEAGLTVTEIACGPGGVGSVKLRRNGDVLMQYSHGWGRYNYALCVKIGHIRQTM